MITCRLMGGLGNQLFQIFTVIAYCLENGYRFGFKNIYQLNSGVNGTTIRFSYWDTFLSTLKIFTNIPENISFKIIKEDGYTFRPLLPLIKSANIELFGYYQSYKYFDKLKGYLFRLIKLNELKIKIKNIPNCQYDFENSISIHFRLGDYKKLPDCHPIMPIEYYDKAIEFILNKSNPLNILYFCEEDDIKEVSEKINILKKKYPLLHFERGFNILEDWEQMILMSCCKYNIIANSTFSWWGAYFNTYNDNIICYPSKWFGAKLLHNTIDLFPPNWNKITIQ